MPGVIGERYRPFFVQKHIDLVGLLYLLAGVLSALVAAAVFILGVGALTIVWWGRAQATPVAASVTAATFIIVAVLLLIWGAANAWAGRELRRGRRPFARLLALGLAMIHLFVLPFGTALGVYSLWVLLHHDSRARFEPGPPAMQPRGGRADATPAGSRVENS
jgi:hypothetical protein